MAAAKTDDVGRADDLSLARLAARLSENRWLIVGAALLLAALYAGGAVSGLGGILIFVLLVGLIAIIPRARAEASPRTLAGATPSAIPANGIRLFAEALPDPCFVLDRRGIVRYANAKAASAFPIRAGESLTFRLRVPDLIAAFDRVAKGGQPERVEFVERVPTERWFEAWFAALDPAPGRPADFVVLILDDMSEQHRVDRVRVDFVANASHELRTPLASLSGFIETLQGPARDDPAARDRFLSIMHDQAERMSRLVADLLSLSRVEMKAHVRPSDTVDLVAVVKHLTDTLEPLARELGVIIEAKLPATPVEVTGERDELIQVFENLIENACKYGQSGKRVVVTVAAAEKGAGPTISVRDFGPGIPEEHLPRLTERFYRIDVEASRKHRGTGLGLAIAKHILARHQARLAIESRLGEGAAFTVVFPLAGSLKGAEPLDNSYRDQALRLS